jgi:hypothetical protein
MTTEKPYIRFSTPSRPWPSHIEEIFLRSYGTCRLCGCTDESACEGGCWWVDLGHTLCSSCVVTVTAKAKP